MLAKLRRVIVESIREVVFGMEDGLVSTLGVVTGIAEGTQNRFVILLSGVVVVIVESLSMAAGTYLSTESENQVQKVLHPRHSARLLLSQGQRSNPRQGALVMGISYIIGGSIPVLPYFVASLREALLFSIIATIVSLFLLGFGKGRLTHTHPLRSGLEMATVSLTAAVIGFLLGKTAASLFPQLQIE